MIKMESDDNILIINEERIKANEVDLNIKEWKMSIDECHAFFKDKTIMHLSDYIAKYDYEIKNKKENTGIVITCTVVNIPYQVRKFNDEKFVFWDVSDLKETQSRLFLTGEACEAHENEKEGIVIALVSPFIKEKDPQYYDSRMLEISRKDQIKIIGYIDGLDKCKGKTRKGFPCKMAVYIPLQGNYCKYHVKQDKKKKKKKVADVNEEGENEEATSKEKKEKVNKTKEKKAKEKKENDTEENTYQINKDQKDIPEGDEYFDVDSIIGMFTKKEVKDKKKKTEMVNNRIKELDDYVKLNNPVSTYENYTTTTTETTANTEGVKVQGVTKKSEDIIAAQCPELLHLIKKTNIGNKKEEEKLKTEEDLKKEKENKLSIEEKQKLRFEKFLNKLNELYKAKNEESTRNLIKGLVYTTNNFNFHLKHIYNSNLVELCYKLMDHKCEEVAIAALKFKRRINQAYIDYYKKRRRKENNENQQSAPTVSHKDDSCKIETKENVKNEEQ